jgi:Flp pilus assembly protein TadG
MSKRNVSRRGSATIWLIVTLPVLLILFCFVLNIAQQWLARVELENALEAAALAAVKEWGDANGGDTLIPREVGVEYANLNRMRGFRVQIGTNYEPDPDLGGVNQNKLCDVVKGPPPDGNLIFGAITHDDPEFPITFNAGVRPSCAAGRVLVDASGEGNLQTDHNNEWGIAFQQTDPPAPAGLMITKVEINVRPNPGDTAIFAGTPIVSAILVDGDADAAVRDDSGNRQADVKGFTDPTNQIQFTIDPMEPWILTIEFFPDATPPDTDAGFEICDRMRFGARVNAKETGQAQIDGDEIGEIGALVTVYFSNGTTATGKMFDNTESKNDCIDPALTGGFCPDPSLIVHPTEIPDLPCPPTSAANNNGQSYVLIGGPGFREFAVRAQATVQVSPLCRCLCAFNDDYCVSGKTIAVYDCVTRRPKLIRVDRFICPGP